MALYSVFMKHWREKCIYKKTDNFSLQIQQILSDMEKPIIYQIFPRIWGNDADSPRKGGSLEDNGTGKFSGIDSPALEYIRWLGCTHVWFTGVIRHSTKAASQGCIPSHPQFVKGEAGSPYAIENYYDVNPYLADDPENRMAEFEALVERTHRAGLKVILDFVPNHVSRDYGMTSPHCVRADGTPAEYLGTGDDRSVHWAPENDFFYYPGQSLYMPDTEEFNAECRALEEKNPDYCCRIVPSWLAGECRKFISEHGADDPGYAALLEKYRPLLVPYIEFPAKATGNNCYSPAPGMNDWYETVKINYTDRHTGTWDRMLDIIRFWASKGVDGFRCDMVELVPPQFFQWLISETKKEFPGIVFIAEVYKKDLYRKYIREVGFDYLYDKSGLYDTLRVIVEKNVNDNGMPVELWQSATGITRNWQFLGDLQPYMLNFLENHDEQRFASDFFGRDARNSFAALYVSLFLNRAPFMMYYGEEMGERGMDEEGFSGMDGRTTIFDWWSVDSVKSLRRMIADGSYRTLAESPESLLPEGKEAREEDVRKEVFRRYSRALRFAAQDPAVRKGTVYDLCYCNYSSDGFDKNRHFAWLRDHEEETLLFVANFSSREASMELLIPAHAFEWLGMPMSEELNPQKHIKVTVPPMDGIMVRLL